MAEGDHDDHIWALRIPEGGEIRMGEDGEMRFHGESGRVWAVDLHLATWPPALTLREIGPAVDVDGVLARMREARR